MSAYFMQGRRSPSHEMVAFGQHLHVQSSRSSGHTIPGKFISRSYRNPKLAQLVYPSGCCVVLPIVSNPIAVHHNIGYPTTSRALLSPPSSSGPMHVVQKYEFDFDKCSED
ncbi:hypothetical protein B0O80DRAFT_421230 [Mortierella sp. GBAus27b]|nr:hypothetical protein B0O80DRAFT_421230 [Mortierella sp. GBAus27b]